LISVPVRSEAVRRFVGDATPARRPPERSVDTREPDPGEALASRGGARVVLATAPSADVISDAVGGLGRNGEVLVVGVPHEPVPVDAAHLVGTCGSVSGWASGHASDWEDTLEFSALRDVISAVERYPFEAAAEAYERMRANEARFRVVLEP
jgi:NADPH2:quinone reductase